MLLYEQSNHFHVQWQMKDTEKDFMLLCLGYVKPFGRVELQKNSFLTDFGTFLHMR